MSNCIEARIIRMLLSKVIIYSTVDEILKFEYKLLDRIADLLNVEFEITIANNL